MATADTGASSVKGATERHTTAVTPEAAISAGARNQNPSKSPTEPVAAKANHMVSSLSECPALEANMSGTTQRWPILHLGAAVVMATFNLIDVRRVQ
jgi:hypothetical protein